MSDPLRDKLTWFRNNLNLLIEDHDLETKKISVDLYFDTLDITHAVFGAVTFYNHGSFNVGSTFEAAAGRPLRDRTLVLCLAFSGGLGPIKLLAPHQAEFLTSLNQNFRLDLHLSPEQIARQFLFAVSKTDSIKKEASILREADERKTLEYVREHAGSATNFFKILQLVRGVTWQDRLLKLRRDRTLRFPEQNDEYESIVESDIFRDLYKAFARHRARKMTANFADAVALTALARRVAQISESVEKPSSVPRFFVSAESPQAEPLFLTVLEQTKLRDRFTYTLHGEKSDVLREADYFVFKSTFQGQMTTTETRPTHREMTRPNELKRLRDDVSSILETPAFIRPEQLAEIKFEGKQLNQVIDDLNTFLFFNNVWLPSSTQEQEFDLAVKDLAAAAGELRSKGFKKGVTAGIEAAKKALQENVVQYQLIKRMWVGVENAANNISQKGIPEDSDYSIEFGLFRFSFPDSSYSKINQILGDLLTGTDAQTHLTHSNLIAACYLAHRSQDKDKYIDELAAAASVLWVAKMFREMVDLLSEVSPLPHYSLELIYAAALAENRHKDRRLTALRNKLYRKYQDAKKLSEKANFAVGVAYVYFNSWRVVHGPSGYLEGDGSKLPQGEFELVARAIKLAKAAYSMIGNWDPRKKIYALNQYLYYQVMGADDSSLDVMRNSVNELLKLRDEGTKELWLHRFDDTLARYYYRVSHTATSAERRNAAINSAEQYAEYASQRARWDEDTKTFLDRVRNRKEQLNAK